MLLRWVLLCQNFNRDVEDPEYKPAPAMFKDDIEV